MKMVKRRRNRRRNFIPIIAIAFFIVMALAIISVVAPAIKDWFSSSSSLNQLDNTITAEVTEYYAPTLIKTDVDNNSCDLSIIVSREDLERAIVSMQQNGTSEAVIHNFWLPSGKAFQFTTTKSDAEKALVLMDTYLEEHPGLTSPPIENILNGVEEETEAAEKTNVSKDTEEPENTATSEEPEATEEPEDSEGTEDTTAINLYARYNVRVDCQFSEGNQYEQYYAAFHDYDIAALHNYCYENSLLSYTITGVKADGYVWNVTIPNYVFNSVQAEIDINPKHASTFTVPVEMERVTTPKPAPTPEEPTGISDDQSESPTDISTDVPDNDVDQDSETLSSEIEDTTAEHPIKSIFEAIPSKLQIAIGIILSVLFLTLVFWLLVRTLDGVAEDAVARYKAEHESHEAPAEEEYEDYEDYENYVDSEGEPEGESGNESENIPKNKPENEPKDNSEDNPEEDFKDGTKDAPEPPKTSNPRPRRHRAARDFINRYTNADEQ